MELKEWSSQLLATTAPAKRRPRIKQAGIAVMEEFAKTNPHPTPDQQLALLNKIHAISGCEHFELVNLVSWFRRHRKMAVEKQDRPGKGRPYASLSKEAIQHLTVLSKDQPHPTPSLVQTWATLLKANKEDIVTWVADEHDGADSTWARESPVHHLPTPVSTSPEPYLDSGVPHVLKVEGGNSPVIPSASPLGSYFHPTSQTPYNIETLPPAQLLAAIADATRAVKPAVPPTTKEEFVAMFDPYMKQMEDVILKNTKYGGTPVP